MNKATILLCTALSTLAAAGCQASGVDRPEGDLEVVQVAEQISGGAPYHIDLHRDDAVFHVAPNLDMARLTVTCPSGPTFSFASYVDLRIRPTGVTYDPATAELILANGAIPEDALRPVAQTFAAAGPQETESLCTCRDDAAGNEYCSCDEVILAR